MRNLERVFRVIAVGVAAMAVSSSGPLAWEPASGPVPESAHLTRAKDLISEDQWAAAIAELRRAVADAKETSKDEALFWLAHSLNQTGDWAEAVDSIYRLRRDFAKSRWCEPAFSLLIELAQKLGRRDVLWRTAAPPAPPMPPAVSPVPRPPARPLRSPRTPAPPPVAGTPPVPPPVAGTPPAAPTPPTAVAPVAPPEPWVMETYAFGNDMRVQALGRLIKTDAPKVIPMLRTIALERDDPGAARRAVVVLALSRNPQAQSAVVEVAKRGSEPVRVVAVRELARFGGENISRELLDVYSTGNVPVKHQVVLSLGERADTAALLRIAQSERDTRLRETAIITLGRAGGREQLRVLYSRAPREARRAIIRGLFTARDEDGLIRIADRESDDALRREVLSRLRLLGTPKAKEYLEKRK